MNRIRYKDGLYEVLLTPNHPVLPSMELLVGNWNDEHLRGFEVKKFKTLEDAQIIAMRLPDMDWYKLVRMHIEHFHNLTKSIKYIVEEYNFLADVYPKATTPEELKDITFNRVSNMGSRYAATYHMNDIISFSIVNPWTKNLDELSKILVNVPELRIKRKQVYNGKIIHLIGVTELGSTYEIKLWPSIIYQAAVWAFKHEFPHDKRNTKKLDMMYNNALKLQNQIDSSIVIR